MAVVLVVDDEAALRTLTSLILRSAGHSVVTAANGLEAVSLYRSAPVEFDAVVTDLDMPVMDGFQLVALIRETRPNARIVCVSGNLERELPAGVALLKKPFTPDALREMLKTALS